MLTLSTALPTEAVDNPALLPVACTTYCFNSKKRLIKKRAIDAKRHD